MRPDFSPSEEEASGAALSAPRERILSRLGPTLTMRCGKGVYRGGKERRP